MVDPADELLAAVEEQLLVWADVSSVATQYKELVSETPSSWSFFEEPPLHSYSFVEESPSQSLSVTEELSVSFGDLTADFLAQPDSSTESPTFTCGCSHIPKEKPCSTLFSPQYYQTMRDSCAGLLKNDLDNIIKGQVMAKKLKSKSNKEHTPQESTKLLKVLAILQAFLCVNGLMNHYYPMKY